MDMYRWSGTAKGGQPNRKLSKKPKEGMSGEKGAGRSIQVPESGERNKIKELRANGGG